jgi:hypothetical protein
VLTLVTHVLPPGRRKVGVGNVVVGLSLNVML